MTSNDSAGVEIRGGKPAIIRLMSWGPKGETAPPAPEQPQLTHSTLFKARQPRVYSATRIYRRPHTTKGTPIRLRRRNASRHPTSPRAPSHHVARGARARRAQRGPRRRHSVWQRINALSARATLPQGQKTLAGHKRHLHARARAAPGRPAPQKKWPSPHLISCPTPAPI